MMATSKSNGMSKVSPNYSRNSAVVKHTPSAPPTFHMNTAVYNYESWTQAEKRVALVGLKLASQMQTTSSNKLKHVLEHWVKEAMSGVEGMDFSRMPSAAELQRFSQFIATKSDVESLKRSSSQISATTQNLVEQPSTRGKKKAKRRPQRWHGNMNGDKKYFLEWPLTVPMVQGAAKTSRKLRAYTKALPSFSSRVSNIQENLITFIETQTGNTIQAPEGWGPTSVIEIAP